MYEENINIFKNGIIYAIFTNINEEKNAYISRVKSEIFTFHIHRHKTGHPTLNELNALFNEKNIKNEKTRIMRIYNSLENKSDIKFELNSLTSALQEFYNKVVYIIVDYNRDNDDKEITEFLNQCENIVIFLNQQPEDDEIEKNKYKHWYASYKKLKQWY